MGIQGLLPLLAANDHISISTLTPLAEFANCTLGIDGHGWLHKAIYGCATALALKQPTTAYLVYIARRLRLLQSLNITPLVVLDGAPPPLKRDTNLGRRQRRDAALQLGRHLHASGQVAEAERAFQSAVGITPAIMQETVSLLKYLKVQYVVSPYEADPQLVYLERIGRIDAILSEDSDLLVFGAQTLVTKWDAQAGTCQVIRAQDMFGERGAFNGWTRNMLVDCAILAGCDYLASAPGVGIKTAMRAVEGVVNADRFDAARSRRSNSSTTPLHLHTMIPGDGDKATLSPSTTSNPVSYRADTLTRAIRRLQFQSNKPSSSSATASSTASHLSSPTYLSAAIRARLAFRHARVWCPFTRRLVCLRPWPPAHERSAPGCDYAVLGLQDVEETDYDGIGPWKPPDVAEKVAKGDVDPVTLRPWQAAAWGCDEARVCQEILRIVNERPISASGRHSDPLDQAVLRAGGEFEADHEDEVYSQDVDVFIEFEPLATSPPLSAQVAHGNGQEEVVIPASDDGPAHGDGPPPLQVASSQNHQSFVQIHLPSPPISDQCSSSESSVSVHASLSQLLPETHTTHLSSLSHPQPQHHERQSMSPQPSSHTPSEIPSRFAQLPSISAMRQLPPHPSMVHPPRSKARTPSSRKSAPATTPQPQLILSAFMQRVGNRVSNVGGAASTGATNSVLSARRASHGNENQSASPAIVTPESRPGSASAKKRSWTSTSGGAAGAVVPRVSGLFQAPKPKQEPQRWSTELGVPPPVKRARNTK